MEAILSDPPLSPTSARTWPYWLAGAALGLPIAYPEVPFYWLAFAAFGFALLTIPFHRVNENPRLVLGVVGLCIAAVISNLFSPYAYVRDAGRFVVTCTYYAFFLFGLIAWDHERPVLAGLGTAILVQACAVIAMAGLHFSWGMGLLNWTQPELRLWGAPWFPDWPNFYAILLSIGFLLFLLHDRRPLPAAICLLAGILTTSRSVLLAMVIALAWLAFTGEARHRLLRLLVLLVPVAAAGAVLGIVVVSSSHFEDFIERMSLLSDREDIWHSSWELFSGHPWFGVGGVMLDESVGHMGFASFHNSYGEILVRHGLVGFALWGFLLLAYVGRMRKGHAGTAILLFLLISAFFQNTLRHPHLFMMFSFFAIAAVPKEDGA